jgi:hypothetical protein
MFLAGDFEEVSLASMANHTCISTNGGGNGTVIVDLSGEKPRGARGGYGRERNKTIPILHNNINRHMNGQNGKSHIDRRVSSPTN